MTTPDPGDAPQLADLLTDLERDPVELVDLLRRERSAIEDESLKRDLARAEVRFLEARSRTGLYGPAFAGAVGNAQRAAQDSELACLKAADADSAAVLFDLAELRAAAMSRGDVGRAAAIDEEIEHRIAALDAGSEELEEEARERFVALSTEEEGLELDARIALLRESERIYTAVGERLDDAKMRSLGRRLGRVACDRVLARRVESVLTRRGAWILENTSLALLLVVLGLLVVESMMNVSAELQNQLWLIDASICVFFIVEFLFKLALAPARASWFVRHVLTDLLPAIPAAMWFVTPTPGGGQETVLLRAVRLLRAASFARSVAAMRPLLRLFRLLLFMAKGMDALVRRFRPMLNRNFVFFEEAVLPRGPRDVTKDSRVLAFRALRREQVLLSDLPVEQASQILLGRARQVSEEFSRMAPTVFGSGTIRRSAVERDVPVEHAIEELYALRSEQIGAWLPRSDILALDRVIRILNAPVIRLLPIIRWFRSRRREESPEGRIVEFGRRIAAVLESWRERALYFADLHGIFTGPQILDRVATAMVKASIRPARNLILFGLFFLIVRFLIGKESMIGQLLQKFVATPVLILGAVCAVVLALGFWLKRIAGEAADQFKLTSEASFIGLLELTKRRSQDRDLEFLGARVFRWDIESWGAAALMAKYLRAARTGRVQEPLGAPPALEDELYRVSLLYLHFLDGSVLHASDVKTSEQLLANLSLENIRFEYLGHDRRDRRRLRKLSLQSGALFGGPYVWFRCITESVSLESAKLVIDYNRHCLSLRQREIATPQQRREFAGWLKRRRNRRGGRLESVKVPDGTSRFVTTEFNVLDFLSVDELREAHIERVFGRGVKRMMEADRRSMIREIFGTRPLHELPRIERTFNFHAFYARHLSSGRVFLAPWFVFVQTLKGLVGSVRKTVDIVREIVAPQAARRLRRSGRAPFAVALRKIHRMKAPTLLEAMQLRVQFDPAYCGAPPGWSGKHGFEDDTELERDMDFLGLHERNRETMREFADENRRRVQELHGLVRDFAEHFDESDPDLARRGERAVTISYMTDRDDVRTLFRAERWLEVELARCESRATQLPARTFRRAFAALVRLFAAHPVDEWIGKQLGHRRISRRGRRNFKRLWHDGDEETRSSILAWSRLPAGAVPGEVALERARAIFRARAEVSREIAALRAVQSLSVLDVRNYRRLVFQLGGYAQDGEDEAAAEALP